VGRELRQDHWYCRTVTLKLKFADFAQHTKSRTLKEPTHATETLFRTGCELLDSIPLSRDLRLIGLSASNLTRDPGWAKLLPDPEAQRHAKLDAALDAITGKFGKKAVRRGRVLEPGE
jgi:DNA polymerase IV